MIKRMIISAAVLLLSGCGGLSHEQIELRETEIEADTELKVKILEEYYKDKGKKEDRESDLQGNLLSDGKRKKKGADMLPSPEGDGVGVSCDTACGGNDPCSDKQCEEECPDLYADMCLPEIPTFSDNNEPDVTTTPEAYNYEHECETDPAPPDETGREANEINLSSGDGNTQSNISGTNNRTIITGGGSQANGKPDPMEVAIAALLLRKLPDLKTQSEITGDETRKTLDTAKKWLTPLMLGYLGGEIVEGFGTGMKEAGDRNNESFNDNSDNSDNSIKIPAEEEVVE